MRKSVLTDYRPKCERQNCKAFRTQRRIFTICDCHQQTDNFYCTEIKNLCIYTKRRKDNPLGRRYKTYLTAGSHLEFKEFLKSRTRKTTTWKNEQKKRSQQAIHQRGKWITTEDERVFNPISNRKTQNHVGNSRRPPDWLKAQGWCGGENRSLQHRRARGQSQPLWRRVCHKRSDSQRSTYTGMQQWWPFWGMQCWNTFIFTLPCRRGPR